jgi:hypothetical protein
LLNPALLTFHAVALTSMMGEACIRAGPAVTAYRRVPSPTRRPPPPQMAVEQDAVAAALAARRGRLKALEEAQTQRARETELLAATNAGASVGAMIEDGSRPLAIEDGHAATAAAAVPGTGPISASAATASTTTAAAAFSDMPHDSSGKATKGKATGEGKGVGKGVGEGLKRRVAMRKHPLPPVAAAAIGLDLAERYVQLHCEGGWAGSETDYALYYGSR